jgi:hypothetical protein
MYEDTNTKHPQFSSHLPTNIPQACRECCHNTSSELVVNSDIPPQSSRQTASCCHTGRVSPSAWDQLHCSCHAEMEHIAKKGTQQLMHRTNSCARCAAYIHGTLQQHAVRHNNLPAAVCLTKAASSPSTNQNQLAATQADHCSASSALRGTIYNTQASHTRLVCCCKIS